MGKTIFLTGSPLTTNLNWHNDSLLSTFQYRIAHFLPTTHEARISHHPPPPPSTLPHAPWRSLPLTRQHLKTGHSQIHEHLPYSQTASSTFLQSSDFSDSLASPSIIYETSSIPRDHASTEIGGSVEAVDDGVVDTQETLLSQFYEHSFALHANLPSSQLPPQPSQSQPQLQTQLFTPESPLYQDNPSTYTSTQQTPPRPSSPRPKPPLHITTPLTTLISLPAPSHILKIHPQTQTITLVAGIIHLAPPKRIITKRGTCSQLQEILVGDDTAAGFTINFWMNDTPAPDLNHNVMSGRVGGTTGDRAMDMESIIRALRVRDIVLFRNIALSTYKGKIFGQSLRKAGTRCEVLYREDEMSFMGVRGYFDKADLVDGRDRVHEDGVEDVVLQQAVAVHDWVVRFVGRVAPVNSNDAEGSSGRRNNKSAGKGGTGARRVAEVLPPDTQ